MKPRLLNRRRSGGWENLTSKPFDFIEIPYLIEDKTHPETSASPPNSTVRSAVSEINPLAEDYSIAANQKQASNGQSNPSAVKRPALLGIAGLISGR